MKKVINIFLAFVLLVATTGVTLNKHYCLGRLQSLSLFESASPCMERGFEKPMPCCNDVSEELKVEEITQASFDFKFIPDNVLLAVTTYLVLSQELPLFDQDKNRYQDYSPPPIERDIPVLVQSFLI